MSHGDGELEYSKCSNFETKDTIDMKIGQEINFRVLFHMVAIKT